MKFVDNAISVSMMSANPGGASTLLKNSLFLGESLNTEQCGIHFGIMIPSVTGGGKRVPPNPIFMPYWKVMSDASWHSEHYIDNCTFKNWKNERNQCGKEIRMFESNPSASDY